MGILQGKKGLIVGIANDHSIAWGCAKAFREAGASLAITYLNGDAEPFVRPLAEKLGAPIVMPLDVQSPDQMAALFKEIKTTWGKLDFLLHAIAYAPKKDLRGRIVDSTVEGFMMAMDISCHSLIRLSHGAEPLMTEGGCILTTTYYGGEKVVDHYGIMGPVKAALEASVRYLAAELGKNGIRVNALSPGPIATRAARGLACFDQLLAEAHLRSVEHKDICIESVGTYARYLVSDEARLVTGSTVYIDAGFNIMAP